MWQSCRLILSVILHCLSVLCNIVCYQDFYVIWVNLLKTLTVLLIFIVNAPEPKAQLHYCHHALSVVHLSLWTFSLKPQNGYWRNGCCKYWICWLSKRIYVALAIFQPYCDLEAGDNLWNCSRETGKQLLDVFYKAFIPPIRRRSILLCTCGLVSNTWCNW